MEQITPEEMVAGTQPTRGEKIMFTPLEEVLAKDAWDDIDVEILVRNQHALDAETLAKLGITKPVPLAPEEVVAQTEALGPVPEESKPEEAAQTTGNDTETEIPATTPDAPVDNTPEEEV